MWQSCSFRCCFLCPGVGNVWYDLLWWNWNTRLVKCRHSRQIQSKCPDCKIPSVDSWASARCCSVG